MNCNRGLPLDFTLNRIIHTFPWPFTPLIILCFTGCAIYVYTVDCVFTWIHTRLPDDPSQGFPLYGHLFLPGNVYTCSLYL